VSKSQHTLAPMPRWGTGAAERNQTVHVNPGAAPYLDENHDHAAAFLAADNGARTAVVDGQLCERTSISAAAADTNLVIS
jgi:hypothetical protein